jgi:hypothetical protein
MDGPIFGHIVARINRDYLRVSGFNRQEAWSTAVTQWEFSSTTFTSRVNRVEL